MEKDVESYLRRQVERLGGIALKFTSPGNAGVPDRLIIFPGGRIWFVELKDDGQKPRPLQIWQMKRLKKLGCHVAMLTGKEETEKWLNEIRTAQLSDESD